MRRSPFSRTIQAPFPPFTTLPDLGEVAPLFFFMDELYQKNSRDDVRQLTKWKKSGEMLWRQDKIFPVHQFFHFAFQSARMLSRPCLFQKDRRIFYLCLCTRACSYSRIILTCWGKTLVFKRSNYKRPLNFRGFFYIGLARKKVNIADKVFVWVNCSTVKIKCSRFDFSRLEFEWVCTPKTRCFSLQVKAGKYKWFFLILKIPRHLWRRILILFQRAPLLPYDRTDIWSGVIVICMTN